METPNCPVDFILVNENKVRLTALSVLILAIIFLFAGHWIIPAFLTVDFLLRGFNLGKYSLLQLTSHKLVSIFNISTKPVDQAPKRFAAKMGFLFSLIILALVLSGYTTTSMYVTVVLCIFAFLESFIGFCAGCYVFSFYHKLFKNKVLRSN